MKPFHFQQFSVQQSGKVFRVGTDAVLLGALCNVENSKRILEVGSGTGIISLMAAQRNLEVQILALDINEEAVKLTEMNFLNSPFSDRMKAELQDFKKIETDEKYDLIISNPPYFEENSSSKDIIARQQKELGFYELIKKAAELLTSDGLLSVIIPFESGEEFITIAEEFQLFLHKRINIQGAEGSKTKRLVLEFGLRKEMFTEDDFVIEKSPRKYSDQYLELTKEFHVFSSKKLLE